MEDSQTDREDPFLSPTSVGFPIPPGFPPGTFFSVLPPNTQLRETPPFVMFVPQQGITPAWRLPEPQVPSVPVPCRYHFSKDKTCRYGDMCFFSHDVEHFMKTNSLKECPNDGCTNLCRGKQCKACHDAMPKKTKTPKNAATQRASTFSREERLCRGHNCTAKTTYTFCHECHQVQMLYRAPRRSQL